jgi:phosphate-selective porin OprO and OprP
MSIKWISRKAMVGVLAFCGLHVGVANASLEQLVSVLEENQTITADQAQELRDSAPRFTVRPAGKVVTDLAIRSRVQAQFGYVDAENDDGSDDFSTFEIRRVRLGVTGTLLDNFRAQLEANLVPGSSLSMRSAFIQWRAHRPAYIKVGYDKPHSSLEENTSSGSILTIERTLLNGLVAAPGPMTGLALDGSVGILSYGAGVYTDANNRNRGGADARYAYNGFARLKLDDFVGADNKFLVQGAYLTSDDEAGKVGSRYDDMFSVAGHFVTGPFDLRAEYMVGEATDDISGFYVMPSYYLTEKLQAVFRFERAESDKATGIRAPSRYLRDVPSLAVERDANGDTVRDVQTGDEYQALYLGLNYYLAGNGHKLMLGVEMSELDNTAAGKLEATTVMTAWRMLF